MLTTLKLLGLSTVVACGTFCGVNDAQASGGGCSCKVQRSCCAPCCAAPAAATPAPATDAPPPPLEGNSAMQERQRYQSAYQAAPMPMARGVVPKRSWSDPFRADHKFLGR